MMRGLVFVLLAVAAGVSLGARAQIAPAPAKAEAVTDRLDDIIADYDALQRAAEPDFRARQEGRAATGWGDVSRGAVLADAAAREALAARLTALGSLTPEEALNRDILLAVLEADIVGARHDLARIPFTGDWGFHMRPIFAAPRTRLTSIADAEAWIARLQDVPRYFGDQITNMRRGVDTGFTAHPDPLANTIDQIAEQAVVRPLESPLFAPFLSLPDHIPSTERKRLRDEGLAATATAIAAYGELLDFLEYEYAASARTGSGLNSLPGGPEAYRDLIAVYTTRPGLTPAEVHRLGQEQVAEIRAEMEAVLAEIGFEGDFAQFLDYLRTDRQFYARTPQELLSRAKEISARLEAILPDYFNTLPRTRFGVRPVPPSIAPGFTTARYLQGDPERGEEGTYLVNTYRLDQRPLYELPALSAHEAVPGHHLQIALAQEMTGVPAFRRNYYATAFGEGWALYAEKIAGEAGIYVTPYEEFGALSYQMWRACRLVADTGIHLYGWTREEAEACFLENTALAPLNVRTEVTRYIGWPGQATAYKVGEITISELRAEAETELGEAFDIRAFHDVVLGEGSMPLSLLERRVRNWIAAQKTPAAEASAP